MIGGPCSGTLFFRNALDSERLRSTLAQALEAYPVLAGRVVSLPADGDTKAPPSRKGEWRRGFPRAVECNNAGAAFTVLDLPGVALPEDRNTVSAPPFPAMWQGTYYGCAWMMHLALTWMIRARIASDGNDGRPARAHPGRHANQLRHGLHDHLLRLTCVQCLHRGLRVLHHSHIMHVHHLQTLWWTAQAPRRSCTTGAGCCVACRLLPCLRRCWTAWHTTLHAA